MVSEHAARAWKRFSAILGIRSALADAGVGVGIHGAGHGSSAAAQSFQDPRHAKDPARCVFRSNQRRLLGLHQRWLCLSKAFRAKLLPYCNRAAKPAYCRQNGRRLDQLSRGSVLQGPSIPLASIQ
jgi:hypothetical protein